MDAFLKGGKINAPEKKSQPSDSKTKKSKALEPWVEKYRPKNVDEVAYQEEVVAVLRKAIEGLDLPNMLLYGPPGTGKTSTILAAAKGLFGDMYRSRILELNSSDERGISVVRDKVKTFSQLSAGGKRPDGKPCPPFKIVILDEADSMTNAAQSALRRTMEKESKTTRFCLICNYVSRIIEPIADILQRRLKEICAKEDVSCSDEALEALMYTSEGDMRKAITTLQSASRFKAGEEITKNDIYEISGVIPNDIIDGIIVICHSGSYEQLESTIKDVIAEGHAATQVILQLHRSLIDNDRLSDAQKSVIFEKLAIVDKRLMDGADEFLQIMDLCSLIMNQVCKNQ
ncbi:hypothetical protein CAPTEDRAFT_223108 [Capitella teleta]|uniref:AAA+ ATPase domain-containing protein n=1 Tax=Capitella teleta TaxID=283909 RepID=R7UZN3_CAPTE|nr:hypothetical protein CAPTEDRAFT_223108 [Capitella teleta]|eukprot:ELU11749.1 hypothetical protein CAPTEDRAFT_223108 [Capitella teleta]